MKEDVNGIVFDLEDHTIQLHDGRIKIWKGSMIDDPEIDLSIDRLKEILMASSFLIKGEMK